MACDMDTGQLPAAAVRQSNFEQAVAYSLHLWPALTLSVQNSWGGPDSEEKRDWFAGAIVGLFPEFIDMSQPGQSSASEEPDSADVEEVLLQVMVDEFDVNVDDDSGYELATQIMRARSQCAIGQFDEVNKLAERFQKLKGKKVQQLFKQGEDEDQDTDWESGDDDDDDDSADVEMGDAPQQPRQRQEPEVDEDGFTKVMHKRR